MIAFVGTICLALSAASLVTGQGYGYASQQKGYKTTSGYAPAPTYEAPVYGHTPKGYQEQSYKPHPYQFGYKIKDNYGNEQSREEAGDAYGTVKGTYGLIDKHGIYRQVEYTADDYGFKAQIKTNEPGTDNQNPADVHIYADPVIVQYEATHKGYGKGSTSGYGKGSTSGYGKGSSSGYGKVQTSYGKAQTGYGKAQTGYGQQSKHQKSYAHAKGTSYGSGASSGYQTPKYSTQYY